MMNRAVDQNDTVVDQNDTILKNIGLLIGNDIETSLFCRRVILPLKARLDMGRKKYGHGVCVDMDMSTFTQNGSDSWIEMAMEEFYDGIIYLNAAKLRCMKENNSNPDKNKAKIAKLDQAIVCLIHRVCDLGEERVESKMEEVAYL